MELEKLLEVSAPEAAKRLLGTVIEREINGQTVKVRVVETEAYDETDAASHSYKGRTERTDVMFGSAGKLYVYFTYGMHYCCNIVVGEEGYGAAVLIRAVEPLGSDEILRENRQGKTGLELTNGPAKLCQALRIDKRLSGHNLQKAPMKLHIMPALPDEDIVSTTRVGISQAKEVAWRFYEKDNPYVSKN
jgi:DNA-3-methyladenine glycosylase